MRMAAELDDTRTTPPSHVTSDGTPVDDVMADTVMTARMASATLVEPTRTVPSREAVEEAVGVSRIAPSANVGLYSFRVGEHAQPVLLDRPVRVGREPAAPRIPAGLTPRLVRVASSSQEVSSTHVELRQVGSSVIVTDLRSTNGSVVMQPGSVARKLRQGESVVVSPGALVDIGDGNILQILPMQRLG